MFKNKNDQIRSGWLICITFITVMVGQTVFSFPGLTLASLISMSKNQVEITIDMANMDPWMIFLIQGFGTIGGIAATFIMFRSLNKKNPNKLGIQGPLRDMGYGLLLGAASMTIIFFVLLFMNQIELGNDLSAPHFSLYTLVYLLIFILVGFFEEIFFRGYVMKTMIERGNTKWLIYVVSAVIFGGAHITNPNVNFLGVVNIMLVGLLFAYMFDTTKSLMLPIGFHITWNFFQGSVFGFPVSGLAPYGMYETKVIQGNPLLTGGDFGIEGGLMATLLIIISFLFTYLYTKNRHDPLITTLKTLPTDSF